MEQKRLYERRWIARLKILLRAILSVQLIVD